MPKVSRKRALILCAVVPVVCCSCGWLSPETTDALRDGRIAFNLAVAAHLDPRLSGTGLSFHVEDGEVRIGGGTLTDDQYSLAATLARDTVGVTRVIGLQDVGEAAIDRTNFNLLSDLTAMVALKQELRARGLGRRVQMDIDGERVTLYGEVSSPAERRAVVATLLGDPEIAEVIDHTRISSEPEQDSGWRTAIDDSIITAQVKLAIRLNSRLAGHPIKVGTSRGSVTLHGSVPSPELARRAGQIAADVAGVAEVVNELTVSPAPADGPDSHRPADG